MESYIHLYEKNSEFTAAYNGPDYKEPWLSLTEENMEVNYNKPKLIDFSTEPLTFNILSNGTISWVASNTAITKTIDYKKNNGEWVSITSTTTGAKITVNPDDKIQFRGDNTAYCGDNPDLCSTFSGSTARFEVEGNIMSLINSTNFTTATTLDNYYTFAGLFGDCTGLTSAENLILPATTLAMGCYSGMFIGCTSLTTAPVLPATTLATGCYSGMFNGCTSLTTAPELPATTLADMCYYEMFGGCTRLTTAPALPATNLTMGCYSFMFYDCTSLNYIKCLATNISASICTSSWVKGVASTGTFVKASSMTSWTTDKNGIPSGWTVQNA